MIADAENIFCSIGYPQAILSDLTGKRYVLFREKTPLIRGFLCILTMRFAHPAQGLCGTKKRGSRTLFPAPRPAKRASRKIARSPSKTRKRSASKESKAAFFQGRSSSFWMHFCADHNGNATPQERLCLWAHGRNTRRRRGRPKRAASTVPRAPPLLSNSPRLSRRGTPCARCRCWPARGRRRTSR